MQFLCLSFFSRRLSAKGLPTDLLVKTSIDIIRDPRQASNCVEKSEDRADNPKIGKPALVFTPWLIEASFWSASSSGGAVAGDDVSFRFSKEKRAIRILAGRESQDTQ